MRSILTDVLFALNLYPRAQFETSGARCRSRIRPVAAGHNATMVVASDKGEEEQGEEIFHIFCEDSLWIINH